MSETIFKYVLHPDETEIRVPIGAEVLSAGTQGEEILVWVKINKDAYDLNELESRNFVVFGTGHPIPHGVSYKFVSTVFMEWMVFHVFEIV